jgi:hypothetical protein
MLQFLLPILQMLGTQAGNATNPKGVGGAVGSFFKKYPQAAGLFGMLGGAMLGKQGQPKTLDMAKMQELFGPQALTAEFNQTMTGLMNSPAVQSAMGQAAEAGSQFSNDINAKSASSMGDAGSGMKVFAQSAGNQAAGNYQREVKGKVAEQAMTAAQQALRDRAAAWTNSQQIQQQTPSWQSQLGGNLMNAGAQAFLGGSKTTTDNAPPPEGGGKTTTQAPLVAGPTASTMGPNIFARGAGAIGSAAGTVGNALASPFRRSASSYRGPSRAVVTNTYRLPPVPKSI